MRKITQSELSLEVAGIVGVPTKWADAVLKVAIARLKDHILAGNKVCLHGFATFASKAKAARKARNPKTGGKVAVPERLRVVARPTVAFKKLLNDGRARRGATTRASQRPEAPPSARELAALAPSRPARAASTRVR